MKFSFASGIRIQARRRNKPVYHQWNAECASPNTARRAVLPPDNSAKHSPIGALARITNTHISSFASTRDTSFFAQRLEPPSRHFRTTIRVRHMNEPIQDFHQCAPRERKSRVSAALPTARRNRVVRDGGRTETLRKLE
jgi:hypothetical protein